MQITNPRERNADKWRQNTQKVEDKLAKIKNQQSITIKTYCEFADMMLDAPEEYFIDEKNSYAIQVLTKPNINYDLKNTKVKQEEKEESGRRIMGVMNYAWDYLIRMIRNKRNRQKINQIEDEQFAQENIKLEMARIQEMLMDLSANKYRWENYTNDDQVEQNILNRQMNEELVFIKLLQNLLKGQIKKMKEGFQKHIEVPQHQQSNQISVPVNSLAATKKQKQIPIHEVVKVKEYFENKMKKIKSQQNTAIDPITKYEQQRKFNISVTKPPHDILLTITLVIFFRSSWIEWYDMLKPSGWLILQQHSRRMKFWHVIVPVVLYLLGYGVLFYHPYFLEDPMEHMNHTSAPVLQDLVQTKFFRIIRLNLNQECKLGHMNKICKSKSCTVCRCDDKDIPTFWSSTDHVHSHHKGKDLWSKQRSKTDKGWVWHVQDLQNDEGEYFDIYSNVQSFTNYNGAYIWQLIYGQNCFQPHGSYEQMCSQEQTLYNVISGLHTSISTHLSRFYRYTNDHTIKSNLKGDHHKFHFNHSEYEKRVLSHPERIKNLLFIYRILAKAINQAAPYFHQNLTINSDNITQDLKAKRLLQKFLKQIQGYDLTSKQKQSLSFFTPDNPKVKEYQRYIHNISSILNCVECQKCRLFGKMQTYGVGTALKILLGYPTPYKRNEIVALFNVFNKITMSVDTYYKNRKQKIVLGFQRINKKYLEWYTYAGSGLAIVLIGLWQLGRRNGDKIEEGKKNQ